jgi:hypothetical protein
MPALAAIVGEAPISATVKRSVEARYCIRPSVEQCDVKPEWIHVDSPMQRTANRPRGRILATDS